MSEREPGSGGREPIEPIEIEPHDGRRLSDWLGLAILMLAVGGVMVLVLLWLTHSILMAVGVAVGMIGLMVVMGWLASDSLGGRN